LTQVFYRLQAGPRMGEERPAVIVNQSAENAFNLIVFTDGKDDGFDFQSGIFRAVAVRHSPARVPGTFRFADEETGETESPKPARCALVELPPPIVEEPGTEETTSVDADQQPRSDSEGAQEITEQPAE
jgi:hypothetical protein